MKRIWAVLLAGAVVVTGSPAAYATHDNASIPCADVTQVFARGSGQSLGGGEAVAFFNRTAERLGPSIVVNSYEVGSEPHGGAQYPAAGVGLNTFDAFKNTLEAEFSITGGLGGSYRASVDAGATEMASYLSGRSARCPDEQFIVGGYSQGAHLTGDVLSRIDRQLRDRIAFAALFGDPKLDLPEGRGVFPPACRGGERSPWRRGNVGCTTDEGSLDARRPYVPSDMTGRVGSWCDKEDPICNNNIFDNKGSSHGDYDAQGGGIDEAAQQAAASLRARLPAKADDIDARILLLGVGTTGLDVAFVIDTTGSMSGRIDGARRAARSLADQVVAARGRVALTEYKDLGDAFVSVVRSPLGQDVEAFQRALDPFTADGGGDTPEALLEALTNTFNTLAWRPGATKAAVVLTDAGFHDPDLANGATTAQVAQRALEIDPVNVYVVGPSFLREEYDELVTLTSGQFVPDDAGSTQESLLDAITQIRTRPTALLEHEQYYAMPGQPVTYDASRSYDADSEIVTYEWDFEGDGVFDLETATPTVTTTYDAPFEGLLQFRVTSADGGVANGVGLLHIDEVGTAALLPSPATSLSARAVPAAGGGRSAVLTWTADQTSVATSWQVRDEAGTLLAAVPSESRTATLSGLPDAGARLSLRSANQHGLSAAVDVLLPPVPAPAPDPSTPVVAPTQVPSADRSPSAPGQAPTAAGPTPPAEGRSSAEPAPVQASRPPGACRPAEVLLSRESVLSTSPAPLGVRAGPGTVVEVLAYSRPSTTYRVVRTAIAGPDGAASLAPVRASTNTRLVARERGCPVGPSKVLNVLTRLSLDAQPLGSRRYRLSGTSLPARPGGLVVSIYRQGPAGARVLVAQARADATTGRWSVERSFTGTGPVRLVAGTDQDLRNGPGSSSPVSLTPP